MAYEGRKNLLSSIFGGSGTPETTPKGKPEPAKLEATKMNPALFRAMFTKAS